MARLECHLNECSLQDGNISVSGIKLWYSPQYRCDSPCLSLRNPMQTQLSQIGSRHFFFLGVLISRLLPVGCAAVCLAPLRPLPEVRHTQTRCFSCSSVSPRFPQPTRTGGLLFQSVSCLASFLADWFKLVFHLFKKFFETFNYTNHNFIDFL